MNYKFFDYKYNIEGFGSDLFGTAHLIFIALSFILVPIVCFLLRKTSHKKIDVFLKIFAVVITLLEITKMTWESYYDITTGRGFNFGGILPLYTCSLLIYTTWFAAYGKGRVKDYSLAYLTTVNLISGGIGIVYCNGLNWYPFWTFGAFYSLFFHFSMFAIGNFLLFTGYKKLGYKDIFKAWVPMVILAVFAIPANYQYGADYMQIYEGSGVPLFNKLASTLADNNLRWVFTEIMLATYIPLAGVAVCTAKFTYYINGKLKRKAMVET